MSVGFLLRKERLGLSNVRRPPPKRRYRSPFFSGRVNLQMPLPERRRKRAARGSTAGLEPAVTPSVTVSWHFRDALKCRYGAFGRSAGGVPAGHYLADPLSQPQDLPTMHSPLCFLAVGLRRLLADQISEARQHGAKTLLVPGGGVGQEQREAMCHFMSKKGT